MLYYLYEYLTNHGIHIPGLNLLKYISFRAAFAVLLSLLIALVYGKKIINYLRNKQMGELVRDLGLEGQKQKEGTPTILIESGYLKNDEEKHLHLNDKHYSDTEL